MLSKGENRLVMLEDILLNQKDTLIDSISIDSEFIFSDKPSHCPHCHIWEIYYGNVMNANQYS